MVLGMAPADLPLARGSILFAHLPKAQAPLQRTCLQAPLPDPATGHISARAGRHTSKVFKARKMQVGRPLCFWMGWMLATRHRLREVSCLPRLASRCSCWACCSLALRFTTSSPPQAHFQPPCAQERPSNVCQHLATRWFLCPFWIPWRAEAVLPERCEEDDGEWQKARASLVPERVLQGLQEATAIVRKDGTVGP